jgi:hypothetical protein
MVGLVDKGELEVVDPGDPILNLGDLRQYDLKKWRRRDRR